jgi:hypothetical protein
MGTLSQKDRSSRTAHVPPDPAHHPCPTAWGGIRFHLTTLRRRRSQPHAVHGHQVLLPLLVANPVETVLRELATGQRVVKAWKPSLSWKLSRWVDPAER